MPTFSLSFSFSVLFLIRDGNLLGFYPLRLNEICLWPSLKVFFICVFLSLSLLNSLSLAISTNLFHSWFIHRSIVSLSFSFISFSSAEKFSNVIWFSNSFLHSFSLSLAHFILCKNVHENLNVFSLSFLLFFFISTLQTQSSLSNFPIAIYFIVYSFRFSLNWDKIILFSSLFPLPTKISENVFRKLVQLDFNAAVNHTWLLNLNYVGQWCLF